jgi:polyphosphate kinase
LLQKTGVKVDDVAIVRVWASRSGSYRSERHEEVRPMAQYAETNPGNDENGAPGSSKEAKLTRATFEKELKKLHIELVKLQEWVKHTGAKIVILFEGRDAAGKGGVIKRITERVSPRVFRVVALPAPTEREKSQIYIQR